MFGMKALEGNETHFMSSTFLLLSFAGLNLIKQNTASLFPSLFH
jgi:hypothetical protein